MYVWNKIKEIRYTPANPSFSIIKVGFKGLYISWTYFPDAIYSWLDLNIIVEHNNIDRYFLIKNADQYAVPSYFMKKHTRITCLCNVYPLEPLFHTVYILISIIALYPHFPVFWG